MSTYKQTKQGVFAQVGSGLIAALFDSDGVPFESKLLPCVHEPSWWDEDAPKRLQVQAAAACRTSCPALDACAARRKEVGDWAQGVWAGHIIPDRDNAKDHEPEIDAELRRWYAQSGITPPGGNT